MKRCRRKRWKSADPTHIFIQFASELQCCTEDISVVPQDISVKATHREYFEVKIFFDKGLSMAMEMDKIELIVELQVFTHIHDQRAVHRQFIPDTQ